MKKVKVQIIDLTPPWYVQLLVDVINFFSYREEVLTQQTQSIIECDVTLVDGVKGKATFRDLFKIDHAEGKFDMWVTALKQYLEVKNGSYSNVVVTFSEDPQDWQPVAPSHIAQWGGPVRRTKIYPRKLYAVKLFGLILRYEEKVSG